MSVHLFIGGPAHGRMAEGEGDVMQVATPPPAQWRPEVVPDPTWFPLVTTYHAQEVQVVRGVVPYRRLYRSRRVYVAQGFGDWALAVRMVDDHAQWDPYRSEYVDEEGRPREAPRR